MSEHPDVDTLLGLAAQARGEGAPRTGQAVEHLVGAAQRLLPGCVACSITQMQASDGGAFRTPAASNLLAVTLDRAQYAAGDGPCVASCRDGRVHRFSVADERHPYRELAIVARRHGVRASLSVPVPGVPVPAALNVYSATWPSTGAPDEVAAVAAFAARCAAAVLGARPPDAAADIRGRRLVTSALRALGDTAGDDAAAFRILVERSRAQHRSVFAVAQDVLATDRATDDRTEAS